MKRSYLFVYSDSVGTRDQIKNFLERMTTIIHWRYDMPNIFYLISENSADEIVKEFEAIAGSKGRFIIIEYNDNSQGRLTEESWFLLNNKYHKRDDAKK